MLVNEHLDMERAIRWAIYSFERINASDISDKDKTLLKEAYVKNYLEPEARRLLQQKLVEKARQNRR